MEQQLFSAKASQRSRWLRACVLVVACITLVASLVAWWILAVTVDRYWFGTVLAFGPRWVLLVPVLTLLPFALLFDRYAVALLVLSAAIVIGPVMDCRWHWPRRSSEARTLRVMTCNLGGQRGFSRLVTQIERESPMVIACQEWPAGTNWPFATPGEWHVVQSGGLLIASRYPNVQIDTLTSPTDTWRTLALACELQTDHGTWRCVCLHLPTPRSGLEAVLHRRWQGIPALNSINRLREAESRLTTDWARSVGAEVVLGDFNMPPESQLLIRDWTAFRNAFSCLGQGFGHTKRTRAWGARIDHVLATSHWAFAEAWVGSEIGSDHRPLIADLMTASANRDIR